MQPDPIAFYIGPIAVRWYGVLIAVAFLIGVLGTTKRAKKCGIDEDDWYSSALIMIVAAIVGARLYYVIFQWPYYASHPEEILALRHGGLAVHGGILLGGLALFLAAKKYKYSAFLGADVLAPFVILGQAIGRWGNFFNQEAYGYAVSKEDVPWAMYIDGDWRHPTFLYESIWDACGFFLLLYLSKRLKPKGAVACAYFMYYSLGRFIVEGFRTDSLMIGPLRTAQMMSLLLFVAGAIGMWWLHHHERKTNLEV